MRPKVRTFAAALQAPRRISCSTGNLGESSDLLAGCKRESTPQHEPASARHEQARTPAVLPAIVPPHGRQSQGFIKSSASAISSNHLSYDLQSRTSETRATHPAQDRYLS